MELTIKRDTYTQKSTIGNLEVDGTYQCHTLEDRVRDHKVYGKTAVPAGRYQVKITYSPRFAKKLPLLMDVPGYEGIRIHPGNTDDDTEGCILPGTTRGPDMVGSSQKAFNDLMAKLIEADAIWITIEDDPMGYESVAYA